MNRPRTARTARTKLLVVLGALGVVVTLGAAISLAAPPLAAPSIGSAPPNPSASTSASFSFTGPSGATFECRLDVGAFAACTSPKSYTALTVGSHTFGVRALKSGQTSSETTTTWSVVVPTATITSGPASPTNATTASFPFTSNASNAAFECKLDAGSFGTCTSPRSYSALGAGSHTFQVRALGPSGSNAGTGAPASFAWTIDLTPPPGPSITGPTGITSSTSASFAFTDAEGGVSFLCSLDGGTFAACTSPKSYSALGQGPHTFQVRARDAAGNESTAASRSWTVDTVAPPAPVLGQVPPDPSPSATATFSWTDSEAGVTFQCLLDEPTPWVACTSPTTFTVNDNNSEQHQLSVRAVDAAGNVSAAATYSWKLDNKAFQISGSVTPLLYPGAAAVPIPLRITNPNTQAIYVTSLVVTATNSPNGCTPSNLDIQQSPASSGTPLSVPANAVNYLVPAAFQPTIRLKNAAANQNVCKSQTFVLSYSGSAHS